MHKEYAKNLDTSQFTK